MLRMGWATTSEKGNASANSAIATKNCARRMVSDVEPAWGQKPAMAALRDKSACPFDERCALKAHETMSPEMATAVKPSRQPRTPGRCRSPNQADAARFCRPDAGHSATPFNQEICRDARVRTTRRWRERDSKRRSYPGLSVDRGRRQALSGFIGGRTSA